MLKRRIIPCLDIKNGRVVKGVHFAGLRDAGDPVEAARAYDQQGADEICLLGPIERCRDRLDAFRAAGVGLPILMAPIGVDGARSVIQAFRR